jgi:hypothetical protein
MDDERASRGWLDAVVESLSDAASLHGAKMRLSAHAAAALTQMVQDDTATDTEAATSVEAADGLAAVVAERAVFATADRANSAASVAQQACAVAAARIAMQSTARAVRDTADAAAALVAGRVRKAADLALADL